MTQSNKDLAPPSLAPETHEHASPRPGRRAFLGAAGTLAAGTVALGKLTHVRADEPTDDPEQRGGRGTQPEAKDALPEDRDLKRRAFQVRLQAARNQNELPVAPHPVNGDEQRYENKIGSDTRGLPHDERGEVDLAAWKLAEQAYKSRRFEDFELIPLGGTRKLVNPVGTLASSLEGINVSQVPLPPAPAIASAERAAEAVEQYWQAVLRDVPFSDFDKNADAQAAAAELDKLSGYKGPRDESGKVTPSVLLRGSVLYADPSDPSGKTPKYVFPPGVLTGPYVSQLAFRDVPYGTQKIAAVSRVPVAGENFLVDYDEWLAVQDGVAPTRTITYEEQPRYVHTVRDLNEYTHGGNPGFWGAALALAAAAGGTPTAPAGVGAPVSPTNPYAKSKTQASANGSFGLGYFQALYNTAVSRAIRLAYWNKWFVHRSIRPEAFGGLVHHRVESGADYPIHEDLLNSKGLAQALSKFGTHLIPHAYPEGAPLHGSYPAGSAVIAGVGATIFKAYFDESFVIPNPVVPDATDPTKLVPYDGPALTLGGELNKLALNATFGRVLSGIHWRSDAAAGLALGEAVVISILQDEKLTFREPFEGFTFTKFDGEKITI